MPLLPIQTLLPPDFPPVHSCQHCEKFILDPDADDPDADESFLDEFNVENWASFDPQLTLGEARKLAKCGCRFCESVSSNPRINDQAMDCIIHYRFVRYKKKLQSIAFSIHNPSDDDEYISDLFEGNRMVRRFYDLEIIAIPGTYPRQL